MTTGVQFRGSVPSGQTRRWFTHSWNANSNVVWMIIPTAPAVDGRAQLEWKVQCTRQTTNLVKWFLEIKNVTNVSVSFEARYAILS
ncbi:MAG: hypothetical protein AAFW95_11550 [Cyanobacteria bacterium J06638_6]